MSIHKENLNMLWGSLIVEELRRNGIDYFCLSPGSRSTPLAVGVARNSGVHSAVIYDERAAAFHALGYARATGKPAVLICTSGTAPRTISRPLWKPRWILSPWWCSRPIARRKNRHRRQSDHPPIPPVRRLCAMVL